MKPDPTTEHEMGTLTYTGGHFRFMVNPPNPDPLHVDDDPWATVEDDRRSAAVIVWMLGAIVAALIVAVALVILRSET